VTRFHKADRFPEWPEPAGPGTQAFDQATREMAARQQEEFDRADAEVLRNSPQNEQRTALIALIDQRIDARLAELRRAADGAAVTRARERLRRQERPA
jgi:hypothetical protein